MGSRGCAFKAEQNSPVSIPKQIDGQLNLQIRLHVTIISGGPAFKTEQASLVRVLFPFH